MTATREVQLNLLDGEIIDGAVRQPRHEPRGWIMPSVYAGTNAELIAAVAPMYLTGGLVVDTTYGLGSWWTKFRPDQFVAHDLDPEKGDGVSFAALPEATGGVHAVCFDPPYVPAGGSRTSGQTKGEADFRDRFGLNPRSRTDIIDLLYAGLPECRRVLAPGGFVLTKCSDYVSGRAFWLGHLDMIRAAEASGLAVHDLIIHHTGSGPGGHNIFTPVRARRHHSYLVVFRRNTSPHLIDPPEDAA